MKNTTRPTTSKKTPVRNTARKAPNKTKKPSTTTRTKARMSTVVHFSEYGALLFDNSVNNPASRNISRSGKKPLRYGKSISNTLNPQHPDSHQSAVFGPAKVLHNNLFVTRFAPRVYVGPSTSNPTRNSKMSFTSSSYINYEEFDRDDGGFRRNYESNSTSSGSYDQYLGNIDALDYNTTPHSPSTTSSSSRSKTTSKSSPKSSQASKSSSSSHSTTGRTSQSDQAKKTHGETPVKPPTDYKREELKDLAI